MSDHATFEDRFGPIATSYVKYRPHYPAMLFDQIVAAAPGLDRCWDCATGNGQAAVALAAHFAEVVATDASASQLAHAAPHDRIDYREESAERTSLPDRSVDAVTVASALHWLPRAAFYAEVRRVAKPGAVIAAWTYSALVRVTPEIDALFDGVVRGELGPHWTPAFRDVDSGYRDLAFPFEPIAVPPIAIEVAWTLEQILGHANTWSASARYHEVHGRHATQVIFEPLQRAWGDPMAVRPVSIPVYVRMGRISPREA